jgi:hypothetical protein
VNFWKNSKGTHGRFYFVKLTGEMTMSQKLKDLLTSRKFWALIASLVSIASGYFVGGVDLFQTLQLLVAAFAAFSVATGLERK